MNFLRGRPAHDPLPGWPGGRGDDLDGIARARTRRPGAGARPCWPSGI